MCCSRAAPWYVFALRDVQDEKIVLGGTFCLDILALPPGIKKIKAREHWRWFGPGRSLLSLSLVFRVHLHLNGRMVTLLVYRSLAGTVHWHALLFVSALLLTILFLRWNGPFFQSSRLLARVVDKLANSDSCLPSPIAQPMDSTHSTQNQSHPLTPLPHPTTNVDVNINTTIASILADSNQTRHRRLSLMKGSARNNPTYPLLSRHPADNNRTHI